MPWKPEYAQKRREKYQSSESERNRRKSQCRSKEENSKYMKEYYKKHPEMKKKTAEQKESRNANRREKYKSDEAYRTAHIDAVREFYKKNPRTRLAQRLKIYGVTLEQHDEVLNSQNGQCAICKSKTPNRRGSKRFHVDHCHATGKFRGLLCSRCNMAIGLLKDDVCFLQNAIEYLSKAR